MCRGSPSEKGPCSEAAAAAGSTPEAAEDYSTGQHAIIRPVTGALPRFGLLGLALVACVLLAVAEFLDLYSIQVITVTKETGSVGGHHGYAQLLIAIGAAAMAVGAVRGASRPAALALVILAVAAVVIALVVDLPVVNDSGLVGRNYEQAEASPETGFYVETLGAVLLLIAAAGIFFFGPRPSDAATGSGSGSARAAARPPRRAVRDR